MFREGRSRARSCRCGTKRVEVLAFMELAPSKICPLFSFSRVPHLPTHLTDACSKPDAPNEDAVQGTGAHRGEQLGLRLQEADAVCRLDSVNAASCV